MNANFPSGRAVARTAPAARPVVAFVGDGPEAVNAAWRAALVARDRALALHLVAVQPLHADLARAAERAEALAAEVRDRLGLDVFARAVAGTREHEGAEVARESSLVVLPPGPPRLLWPFGSPVLRMVRRSGRPVLLARRPAQASYRRVLASVELELDACSLIAAARALSRDPCMNVLHVLDTAHEEAMREADVPLRTIRAQRERDAARARRVLADLIASVGASDEAQPVVSFGRVGRALLARQVATRADLVVVGRRPRPALSDALPGRVTPAVLREARADVLVLPMPPRAPAASWHLPEFAAVPAR